MRLGGFSGCVGRLGRMVGYVQSNLCVWALIDIIFLM
jgi:hypothetical protein